MIDLIPLVFMASVENIGTIRNLPKIYRQGEIGREGHKVQIRKPDKFLTPELSTKVEFLKTP